jgi:hypothetical protein
MGRSNMEISNFGEDWLLLQTLALKIVKISDARLTPDFIFSGKLISNP